MTRSQIISNLITKYDKVVTGNDKSAIELAVFKIAICQLVDAAFSGGGGGGGTTIGTVSDGIDASIDINAIVTSLASINTNQLTQAGVIAAIQSAADIDTIITRLTSIETNTAGGGGGTSSATIASGVDASVDISTIITQLTAINTNTASSGGTSVVSSYDHGSLNVNSTGVQIRGVNVSRKHLIIVNNSTTDKINLFFAAVGVFGDGLPVLPQQSYEMTASNLYRGVIRAITASGVTVNLSITEGI